MSDLAFDILLALQRAPSPARLLPGRGAEKQAALQTLLVAGFARRTLAPGQSAAHPVYRYELAPAGRARVRRGRE